MLTAFADVVAMKKGKPDVKARQVCELQVQASSPSQARDEPSTEPEEEPEAALKRAEWIPEDVGPRLVS